MVSYQSVISAIFIAFFIFGISKLVVNNEVNEGIKQVIAEQSAVHPIASAIFIKELDEMTPTVNYKLPFSEKKIFLINEFPLPGWTHIIMILVLFFVAGTIMHFTKTDKWVQAGIFILLILVGYILASLIMYYAYFHSSGILGLTAQEAHDFRMSFANGLDNVVLPLFIMGFVGVAIIGKAFFNRMKK